MNSATSAWSGLVLSIQPRIRLLRSFDQRSHTYLGYVVRLAGSIEDEPRTFAIAIVEAAHARNAIQVGDALSGVGDPVANPRSEVADLYKIRRLRVERRAEGRPDSPPPWQGAPPELSVYRERGHRRLATRTYSASCMSCIWGCRMPVEIIVDHWNPTKRRYREETFCYGPLSCQLYRPGPTCKVPGRRGMTWEEEDWMDHEAVAHRGSDD